MGRVFFAVLLTAVVFGIRVSAADPAAAPAGAKAKPVARKSWKAAAPAFSEAPLDATAQPAVRPVAPAAAQPPADSSRPWTGVHIGVDAGLAR